MVAEPCTRLANKPNQWFGEVPSDWEVRRAWTIFKERVELSDAGEEALLSVSEYYGVKPKSEVIDDGDFESRSLSLEGYRKCYRGDLVMNYMLAWKGSHGISDYDGIVSPAYAVFKFTTRQEPRYFHYLLRSPSACCEFRRHSTGIIDSRLRLYPEDFLHQVRLPIPPLAEQIAIADFLDHETAKIDTLILKQQSLIDLLTEKRQAVISDAVTRGLDPSVALKDSGVVWLGLVPQQWSTVALKRIWSVTDCKHVTPEFVDDGIPLASIREVQGWEVNLDDARQTTEEFYRSLTEGSRTPTEGDVIFSRNATVGQTAKVTARHPKFAMGQDVCLLRKLRSDECTDFLLFVMRSNIVAAQLANLMIGSTFKRINVEEIKSIVCPSPPPHEQDAIAAHLAAVVARIEILITKAQKSISLMKERRSALISAAVTGKIDIRSVAN